MNEITNNSDRLALFLGRAPKISGAVFIARTATVVGDVTLGNKTSVFYGAVLRADIQSIVVGDGTNIQDNAVVHLANDRGVVIGDWCTIGHSAIVHACTIGHECLVGMGATVLDHAEIGDGCMIGANSLVPQRFRAPPGMLIYGSPAKIIRPLTNEEKSGLRTLAEKYVEVAVAHAALR